MRKWAITDDPSDPRLTHGTDSEPIEQAETYLVLSKEEREKGFIRPVRTAYVHIGPNSVKRGLTSYWMQCNDNYGKGTC